MGELNVSFAAGVDLDAATAQAEAILRREGVVVLDHLVDPALLAQCKSEIEIAYPDYALVDRQRNYGSFPGRHTMPLCIENSLADRSIFFPPVIDAIAVNMLGKGYLMESLGLLVSLPGATDQTAHPDATLFPEVGIAHILPTFALALSIPLVPMDEVSGTTAFWRRSHRIQAMEEQYDFAPIVQPGSAILWDFRTFHCGLANRGEAPRPVIYSVFSRYWWVEIHPPQATGYHKFLIARDVYDALPPRLQRRSSRARLVDGDHMIAAYEVGSGEGR